MLKQIDTNKKTTRVFHGKKIFIISADQELTRLIHETLSPHGAILFNALTPAEAIGNVLAKNPDLIIYDENMPSFNGSTVLSVIKQKRPKGKILFLNRAGVPLRSIDVTAQGVSFSIARNSNPQQIYNGVKHCLAVASVPRVESMAS